MVAPKKPVATHRLTAPFFLTWRPTQAWRIARAHPLLLLLSVAFALVVPLEHAMTMVPRGGEPYDAGFVATDAVHQFLKRRPAVNDLLAAANTVLVSFQAVYVFMAWVVIGRFRPALAVAFLYTSRSILGWSTQLPVPRDFLGSKVDFPVGNASFFLFFSGHVGLSIIAALDMRCAGKMHGAIAMDAMNMAQIVRLLATRGHYTIDLGSGAIVGWACYHLAGWYEQGMLDNNGRESSNSNILGLDKKDSLMELE